MSITELDFHVHAGCEMGGRKQSDYVEALAARGVKLAGLLDHCEFYFTEQSPWHVEFRANAAAKGITLYEPSMEGLRRLYRDLEALRPHSPVKFATGLEVCQVAPTPEAFFEYPQYISNCFSIRDNPTIPNFGEVAAGRIATFARKIKGSGKLGIINHPFRDRFGTYRDSINAGKSMPPIREWITVDDVKRIAAAAADNGMYLEVNTGSLSYYARFDCTKDLVVHTMTALSDTNVDLSTGSDSHAPPAPQVPAEVLWVLEQSGLREERFAGVRRRMAALAGLSERSG